MYVGVEGVTPTIIGLLPLKIFVFLLVTYVNQRTMKKHVLMIVGKMP